MPKLYEYFGLIFFVWTHEHYPMHLHVQRGNQEGIVELLVENGKLVALRWRSKKGVPALLPKDQRDAELFVKNKFDDIKAKWVAYFVEHRPIKPERITRRVK